ncbi:MAG: succinate dehydrogenase cytochrome b subunit [Krumholzibacteria bacterium]|nr:succinate dehydrogenase cytochrome b subunit [Candidatus Krumholzibacteria bacterium]
MASLGSIAWSSVGKKVITGITGLALFGFVCVHLLGNLTLLIGPNAFNSYAHFLETAAHGWLIYAFEVYIIAVFLFHIVSAVTVAWTDKRKARQAGYKYSRDAGGKSRKSLASRSMIYTGAILLVFIIGHIFLFKFNGGNPHTLDEHGYKDLYKVVDEVFASLGFVIFTVVSMILLGLHLRHGFWSAFQSLGWANDRYLPLLENLARVVAVVIAVGYIILPIYMHLTQPGGH